MRLVPPVQALLQADGTGGWEARGGWPIARLDTRDHFRGPGRAACPDLTRESRRVCVLPGRRVRNQPVKMARFMTGRHAGPHKVGRSGQP